MSVHVTEADTMMMGIAVETAVKRMARDGQVKVRIIEKRLRMGNVRSLIRVRDYISEELLKAVNASTQSNLKHARMTNEVRLLQNRFY